MKFVFSCLLALIGFSTQAQWTLIWADEFDADSLDTSKWVPETGGWGWGNNELQYYTDGDNLSFANGELTIEARDEQFGANQYTSGKIITEYLFGVRYGKVEARIQVPSGQGIWPAFWMLGTNIDQISWPYCGEIDVMEHINNEAQIHGTAHWDNNGHAYYGNSFSLDPSTYHVYSIEWDSTAITWKADGSVYHVMNIANGINGTSEFHLPFYLILNLAVGGNWPGYPDATTIFPSQLKVDYVRVYKADHEIGIAETTTESLGLYPNPTSSVVQCQSSTEQNLAIYSIDGRLIQEHRLNVGQNQIPVHNLAKGSYLFVATNQQGKVSADRFVKE